MQKKAGQNNRKQSNAVQNLSVKKSTKTPRLNLTQKTRAKYECSEKLAEMIEQANLIPKNFYFSIEEFINAKDRRYSFDIEFIEYLMSLPEEIKHFVFLSKETSEYEKQDSLEFWQNNDGYAQDILADLNSDEEISDVTYESLINSSADDIAEFLVDYGYYGSDYSYDKQLEKEKAECSRWSYDEIPEDKETDSRRIWRILHYAKSLERLQNIKNFLLLIINLGENFSPIDFQNNEISYLDRKNHEYLTRLANTELASKRQQDKILATTITLNEKGEIQFSISEWASALQGVDITRIRRCEICEKIFWANRSDAFACSKKHAKTRQMRLLRANWKEKEDLYLKARKKKENNKKEKKNGTL